MLKSILHNSIFLFYFALTCMFFNANAQTKLAEKSVYYQKYQEIINNNKILHSEKYHLLKSLSEDFHKDSPPQIAALIYTKLMALSIRENQLDDFQHWKEKALQITLPVNDKQIIELLIQINQTEFYHHQGFFELAIVLGENLITQLSDVNIHEKHNITQNRLTLSLKNKAMLYNVLGASHFSTSEYESAHNYFVMAVKLYEKNDDLNGMQIAYNNLSLTSWAQQDYQKAIELVNQALTLSYQLNNPKGVITNLSNLGIYQDAIGEYESALASFEQVLDYQHIANYPKMKVRTLLGKAQTLHHQNLYTESENTIRAAMQISVEIKDTIGELNAKVELANLLRQQKKFDQALSLYISALEHFENVHLKQDQLTVLKEISNLYQQQGNLGKALEYYKQYNALNTELLNKAQKASILKLSEEYELQHKEKQIKLLEQENQLSHIKLKNTRVQQYFIVFIALSIIIITSLSLSRRFNRKEAQRLAQHNKEIKANEKELLLLSHAFSNTSDAVWITNATFEIVAVNNAFVQQTHKTKREVIGQPVCFACVKGQDETLAQHILQQAKYEGAWQGEIYDLRSEGEIYPIELNVEAIVNDQDEVIHYLGVSKDITERKRNQEQLAKLATHDDLTELPNRTLFEQLIQQSCLNSQHTDKNPVVMLINVNGFKKINDSFSHSTGDKIIQEIAKRLKSILYSKDVIARITGAEFGLLFELKDPQHNAGRIAQKILSIFDSAFNINNNPFIISASIGITIAPFDGNEAQELLRKTAIAMVDVKRNEKHYYRFYEPHMNSKAVQQLAQEQKVLNAIAAKEFSFYFQPIVEVNTGKITGAEALIRWIQPDGTIIPPDSFIPLAEQAGFIEQIDQITIDSVFHQISKWHEQQHDAGTIAINLSASIFSKPQQLLTTLNTKLSQYNIEAKSIKLELTEGMLLNDIETAIDTMNKLKSLGFQLALDDFGTGFSSLSYLKKFPVDILKVDRSFIMEMHTNPTDLNIVRSLISLAHTLNLQVIAEGIEIKEHVDILQQMNCEEYQGYYCSKPLPAEDFKQLKQNNMVSS